MKPINLTRTEQLVLKVIAKKHSLLHQTAEHAYLNYLAGTPLPTNATAWQYDLWREAKEREHLHA